MKTWKRGENAKNKAISCSKQQRSRRRQPIIFHTQLCQMGSQEKAMSLLVHLQIQEHHLSAISTAKGMRKFRNILSTIYQAGSHTHPNQYHHIKCKIAIIMRMHNLEMCKLLVTKILQNKRDKLKLLRKTNFSWMPSSQSKKVLNVQVISSNSQQEDQKLIQKK